jgi:toxin ParE1/3/4
MSEIFRNRLAIEDVFGIWNYIALESQRPLAASNLLRRFDTVLQKLANHPELGEVYASVSKVVRVFPVGSYVLIYRPRENGIELLRVIHGARTWQDFV